MGGSDGQSSLNTVECFDPDTEEWTNVPCMSVARVNAGATVIEGRLYVVGGFNGKLFLNTMECFSADATQWNTFAVHMLRDRNQDSPTFGTEVTTENEVNAENGTSEKVFSE